VTRVAAEADAAEGDAAEGGAAEGGAAEGGAAEGGAAEGGAAEGEAAEGDPAKSGSAESTIAAGVAATDPRGVSACARLDSNTTHAQDRTPPRRRAPRIRLINGKSLSFEDRGSTPLRVHAAHSGIAQKV
jgi:hypothetical protein